MTRAENSKRGPRQRFNKLFRQEAVELWRQSGKTGAEVAAELGIRPNNLYNWAKQSASSTAATSSNPADLAAENAALRRENERLRQQRDILKKTLGILSEPPNTATSGFTK